MSGAVEISYDWSHKLFEDYASAAYKRHKPGYFRVLFSARMLAFLALVVTAAALALIVLRPAPREVDAWFIGFIAGALVGAAMLLQVLLLHRRIAVEAEVALRNRRGRQAVTLSENGVVSALGGDRHEMAWDAIHGVIETKLGLGLLVTELGFLPLPDAALPEGWGRDALKARLRDWRGGAAAAGN